MKLSEWIRAESFPCGDPDWMPKLEKLEEENDALRKGYARIERRASDIHFAVTVLWGIAKDVNMENPVGYFSDAILEKQND